jgi:predicted solute-binding protein
MVNRLAHHPFSPAGLPRIGAVQYLNTKPLVYGLAARGVGVAYDLPSRLADQLSSGLLDVALIPSIELFRGSGYRVVSDACIGCRGPVMSVKLFFRTLPGRVARLAVDEGSRTSATLARILLAERHGVVPEVETLPIGAGIADTSADAGRINLASIAAAEAASHGLTVPQCLSYLRDNLHYELGPRERAALVRFYRHAEALSLAPAGVDVAVSLTSPV